MTLYVSTVPPGPILQGPGEINNSEGSGKKETLIFGAHAKRTATFPRF